MAEETKIEPTLTLITDAPSIAAVPEIPIKAAEPPAIEPLKIEPVVAEAAKIEALKPVAIEAAKPAAPAEIAEIKAPPVLPRVVHLSVEPKAEAPVAPAAASAAEAEPKAPRDYRFALLAASALIAASLGAVGGWVGATKYGLGDFAARRDSEEIRVLKDSVVQLRAVAKTLNENIAGLKLSVGSSTAQVAKMAETVERIDRAQEQRRVAAATPPAGDVTGSIQTKPVPMVLGTPPAMLQHPIVPGWVVRRVRDGVAVLEGHEGVIEVIPGATLPGLGRIEDIRRQDGRWVVLTSKGIIVSAR